MISSMGMSGHRPELFELARDRTCYLSRPKQSILCAASIDYASIHCIILLARRGLRRSSALVWLPVSRRTSPST